MPITHIPNPTITNSTILNLIIPSSGISDGTEEIFQPSPVRTIIPLNFSPARTAPNCSSRILDRCNFLYMDQVIFDYPIETTSEEEHYLYLVLLKVDEKSWGLIRKNRSEITTWQEVELDEHYAEVHPVGQTKEIRCNNRKCFMINAGVVS